MTTINGATIENQQDFNDRVRWATILGTLQASYTNFHYLRKEWRDVTEKEALTGVSITGIASMPKDLDLDEAAQVAKKINDILAPLVGIEKAHRITAIKPEGTASEVLGTSSGIHGYFAPYYIRRVTVRKDEPMYQFLSIYHPELLEDKLDEPETVAFITIPKRAPEGAVLGSEPSLQTLERVKKFNKEWVGGGHREGKNKNNVSCTIYIKPDEWDEVADWMWKNRDDYTAISILPYSDHTYSQAPFEEITEAEYLERVKVLHEVNMEYLIETDDNTDLQGELACAGGACEIK